jgi:hypothetical protein
VDRGPIKDVHKVVRLAQQAGGLKSLTEDELSRTFTGFAAAYMIANGTRRPAR